jgi:acetolactate synthase I/II/III large subunit
MIERHEAKPIRVADYVAHALVRFGISHVFMVTGGGAMHLNDALGHCDAICPICCHHEQACAMAAEAYARLTGNIAVVNVTSGPGGINALNGVFGAWTDSIPMLILSGQVKRETCLYKHDLIGKLRQLGDQEADIISMVRGVTKYAVTIDDPLSIRYHLERAVHVAQSGRPGPCWLDVPLDVQGAAIDPEMLHAYDPTKEPALWSPDEVKGKCEALAQRLRRAERPAILVGSGVHVSRAYAGFERLIRRLQIPVTTAWTAIDLLPTGDPLYCGRPGTVGDRAGNFAIQNADLVLTIGCRLAIRQVSYNWQSFARHAFKVQVDIDPAELDKPMACPDLPIHSDCGFFFEALLHALEDYDGTRFLEWLAWCKERQQKYPVVLPHQRTQSEAINPYHFMEVLFDRLAPGDTIACGNASAAVIAFQVAQVKPGQRIFSNAGSASMGYDLPAAIGAACARGDSRIFCLAGDGSIMMNLQELQTIAHHGMPVKIMVLNNAGYLSIRSTQMAFFDRLVGEGKESGVSFPDFAAIGAAFGIPSTRISGPSFAEKLEAFLSQDGPALADVLLDGRQLFEPKVAARALPDGRIVSSELEDMSPFLSREELQGNLLYPLSR